MASSPPSKKARTKAPDSAPSDSDHAMVDSDDELFEYESDVPDGADEDELNDTPSVGSDGEGEGDATMQAIDAVMIISSDDDDDEPARPPPETDVRRARPTSRKLYQNDVQQLIEQFGSAEGHLVTNFKKDGDENVNFTLVHPAFSRGLQLVIMSPDLGGYPKSHQSVCYAESGDVASDVVAVLEEVGMLPSEADRSIGGLVQYLISRLLLGEPSPYQQASQQTEEQSDEEYEYDEDDFVISGGSNEQVIARRAAIRKDLNEIKKAGYYPGYTHLGGVDCVISVSKEVHTLGVPLAALQAWDSSLITGEVRYLVLLMNFGAKYPINPDNGTKGEVKFKVGLSPTYKPSKEAIAAAFREHSAINHTPNDFDAISLSAPLDKLFEDKFQELLLTRRSQPGNIGWAGAEHHCLTPGRASETFDKKACKAADKDEASLAGDYTLPKDPMTAPGSGRKVPETANNYPLLSFSYLLRRFVMCPRFCLQCFKKIESGIVALKPFVCDSQLCLFQLFNLGLGPSLEHEIKTNSPAVDLLIQLAFVGAKDDGLKVEMQPVGLGLFVPKTAHVPFKLGDETVDFDALGVRERNVGMAALISELPPVPEMKAWLNGDDLSDCDKQLRRDRKLQEMKGGSISLSAWKLLRWIVASNTSYLKQVDDDDELVVNIPKEYRQFRLVVGSPAKEHKLAENIKAAQRVDGNARAYPSLWAWHGSAVKNWHNILREGLHFKDTTNGRAYGHGVYFAKNGEISLGTYAQQTTSTWKNAEFGVGKLAAICEIVNRPSSFVSSNPYFVVSDIDWIQCRYLIIQRTTSYNYTASENPAVADVAAPPLVNQLTKPVPLDPAHPVTLNNKLISVPDLLPKLEAINRKLKQKKVAYSESDTEACEEPRNPASAPPDTPKARGKRALGSTNSSSRVAAPPALPVETFVPCSEEILKHVKVLPPPSKPNAGAVRMITTEMRNLIKEQEELGPVKAGFYFDFERSNGSLFTWIIEVPAASFDQTIPLIADMKAKKVNSLLFEIRFSEAFPHSPPFFRLVYPRFLPFIQGGGGHITGGGSICMDLLTESGWNPVYQITAILLQIRMAISNLEPKPARLDPTTWNRPYGMAEAVAGFERAAATHGWRVPAELAALTRGG